MKTTSSGGLPKSQQSCANTEQSKATHHNYSTQINVGNIPAVGYTYYAPCWPAPLTPSVIASAQQVPYPIYIPPVLQAQYYRATPSFTGYANRSYFNQQVSTPTNQRPNLHNYQAAGSSSSGRENSTQYPNAEELRKYGRPR